MSEFKIKVDVDLNVDDIESQLKKLGKDNKISIDFDNLDLGKIETQLNRIKNTFKNTFKFDKGFIKDINKLTNALDKLSRSGANTNLVNNTVSQYKDLANTVTKLQKQLNKGGLGEESIKRTKEQINKLKADMESLFNKMSSSQKKSLELFNFKNANKDIVDLNNNLNKIDTQINNVENKASNINMDFLSESSKDELEKILRKIEEIKTEAREDIKLEIETGEALTQLKDVNDEINKLQKEANKNAREYSKTISKQTGGLKGFWEDYKGEVFAHSVGDILGDFTVDSLRSAISVVMDLDAAFTDLRKVSDVPIDGALYESIKSQAIETAKEVGMSSAEVVQSIATATQMGAKNIEEATAIARQSMILSNVGDMDSDMASQAVATIMNSYNLDALKEISVVQNGTTKSTNELTNAMDMLNHATNNYAIDSVGLSSALADVGSVLNAYGISLGDSIALITAANESMGDPTKVANGLKSIAINMAGLQTSAKDGTITLNKTAKALGEIAGIDIYADKKTGQIKDMTVLLGELQSKWHTLSEEEQLALSNAIAGKQNAAVFQALMSNYETFKQLQGEFNEGLHFGSAEAENAQYVDSIAGKLNKLKEVWTSIVTTFAKSDFIKGALDALISLSEIIEKIVSTDIGSFAIGFTALGKTLSSIGKFFGVGKTLGKLFDVGDTAGDIIDIATAGKQLTGTFGKSNKGILDIVKSLGLFGSVGASATTLLTTGLIGLIGYTIAYGKIQSEVRDKRMDERRENMNTLRQEINAEKQKIESLREIASEYDSLRSKTNLTAEEQERYLELNRQIAELYPELVSGYDENGDPILKLNGSLLTYINNLDRAVAKQEKLLNSEENEQAKEWEEKKKEIKLEENKFRSDPTGIPKVDAGYNDPKLDNDFGEDWDAKDYLDEYKKYIENEKKLYDDELKIYEEKEQAIADIREKARNDLQKDARYKNASDKDKEEMEAIIDEGNFYELSEDEQEEFTKGLAKLDDELVGTTEDLGEHGKAIDKAEEKYRNGKSTLDEYTDSVTEAYEAAGKADVESLREWMSAVEEYGNLTGDVEGVNRQINQMGDTLEGISGIDSDIWVKALTPNLAPLEEADKRLDQFLRKYGTGSEHLGKGGLADKLEIEWQSLEDLNVEIAEEYQKNGKISVPFILEATVDSPTPIKNLVSEFIQDGVVSDEEVEVLLMVSADLQNEGEISEETEKKLREILPDEIEDEVIANIKVSTDAYQEEKVDEFLKQRDELDKDVEAEIRMHVNGTDEAEALYNATEKLPEEKRLEFVSNYGLVKDELYMAGVAIDEIPTDVLINIATNFDADHISMISELYQNYDHETITAFLQIKGAPEALAQCESVEEMMEVIENYNPTGKVEVKTEGKEDVETTKTSLESIEGTYDADLMVHTDKGELDYIEGQIYNIDGQQYMCVFNVDTNEHELVEFNGEINKVPEEKNTTITTEYDSSGVEIAKQDVKSIEDTKVEPEITPVVKESGGIVDKIKNLFGGNKSTPQEINVKATVNEVDTSKITSTNVEPIEAKAQVAEVDTSMISNVQPPTIKITADSSNAMLKIQNVTQGLASIKDKTVKILADSSNAMSKITNITNGLNTISDKTVKILGDSSNATLKISNVTQGLSNIPDKTVKILADSSNAMSKINNVKKGLDGLKNKTITIKANASQAISTINSVKSALSGVRNKTVSVSVNKTVTERTVSQSSNVKQSTPMLTNSSLASVPVSASASPLSDTPVTISDNSLSSVPVSTRASSYGTLDASKILPSLDLGISHIKNLEEALERLGNQLDFINEKSEATFGQEKVNLLQQQIPLLKEQQKIQEQIANSERKQNNELIYWLNNNGFKFDTLGNIANYNDKLLQMEQNVESLKKKHDDLNSVSGDNKNEKAIKAANDAYENANETLSKAKKYLEEYFTTNNKEITEASKKWWELENAIREVNDELEELRRNNSIEPLQNSLQEVEYLLDRQSDRLDLLDAQYEKATGEKRVEGLIKKEQILNEQLATQEEAYKRIYNLVAGLQKDLWQFGFKLDGNSLITNYDEVLNALVGTAEYERAKKYADEYMDVVRGDLIDIQKEAYETQNAIADLAEEMQEALDEAREERLAPFKNTLESVRYELDRVVDRLDLLDSANERSQGKTKVDYLHDKIGLLNEEIATSQKEFSALYNLIAEAQNDLWQYGFRLDENSLIDNYDGVLNGLVGTEKYESAKKAADEYMSLMRDDYIENKLSISDLQNEIKELQDEIEKAERELALFSSTNRLTELNEEFEELSNKIDVIGTKLEHAYGTDKITLMRKEIELLNDQLELQDKKMNTMLEQAQTYTNSLSKYGFTFDENGSISNYAEILDIFRDDEQIENIKELCEEYMDLQDEISGLSSEYADLESAVKDAYKEMLDTTEDIEKEITEVIEKEYEKRKEEIEKYTDERIALLEKEKKEMQELWDEQDYEKSVKEQSDEIMELQKRISILSKDTSIAGQQKLKELTEELEEAQKKLEEITEDKIKDDYTNNIDGEIEKLEDEEKTLLEALDEKFSETNIAKMVQEALTTGFIELNGEMQSIQDALINNINQSADAYSAMAEIIKNELVANLNVALSTTKELSSIYENLDLNEYGRISALENIALSTPSGSTNASNISFGDTVFNISGSADNTTLEQVEEMIKQSQDEMLDKITRNV